MIIKESIKDVFKPKDVSKSYKEILEILEDYFLADSNKYWKPDAIMKGYQNYYLLKFLWNDSGRGGAVEYLEIEKDSNLPVSTPTTSYMNKSDDSMKHFGTGDYYFFIDMLISICNFIPILEIFHCFFSGVSIRHFFNFFGYFFAINWHR